MKIERKILDPRLFDLPTYATVKSAAMDMRLSSFAGQRVTGLVTMYPGDKAMIGTGLALHLDMPGEGLELNGLTLAAQLLPRSGLGNKGLRLTNTIGLIDGDYQGEIFIAAHWTGADPITFEPLERIAQLVVLPVLQVECIDVMEFSNKTERGAGGFGSTGSK